MFADFGVFIRRWFSGIGHGVHCVSRVCQCQNSCVELNGSGFHEPFAGFVLLTFVKVFYFGHGKRFANHRHPFLPILFSDHRDFFDVTAVLGSEFDVFPRAPISQP